MAGQNGRGEQGDSRYDMASQPVFGQPLGAGANGKQIKDRLIVHLISLNNSTETENVRIFWRAAGFRESGDCIKTS
jgi:hypothetical protein